MNCNRLSLGALVLVMLVSAAGMAMTIKSTLYRPAEHVRLGTPEDFARIAQLRPTTTKL